MNRSYALNLKLWGSLLALTALSSLTGLYATNESLQRLTGARANAISQNDQLSQIGRSTDMEKARIESEAAETQAKIDNNINVFDSVTITGYTCDPASPPDFDPAPFVDGSRAVKVSDQNQRVIGYISFTGEFFFEPDRCNL